MIRFRCLLRLDCGFLLTSLLFPEILDLPEFPVLPEIPGSSEALLLLPATGVLAPSLIRLPVSELPSGCIGCISFSSMLYLLSDLIIAKQMCPVIIYLTKSSLRGIRVPKFVDPRC